MMEQGFRLPWVLLSILGIASILGLLALILAVVLDSMHRQLGRTPSSGDIPGWAKGVVLLMALGPSLVVLAYPEFSPVFLGALLIACLIYKRVPRGADFWGRPTHVRWEVRFNLSQLLGIVLVLGALMGWFFYLKQHVWRVREHEQNPPPAAAPGATPPRPGPAPGTPAGTRSTEPS